jgi:hypothetical protein
MPYNSQRQYYPFRSVASLPLLSFRDAPSGDPGNIAAIGGLLASDSTPALSGTGSTVSPQILWATGNVDPILMDVALGEDFDGRDDVTLELLVASGTTDPATFTVLTSWDGGANVTDTASDAGTLSATVHKITATIAAADIPDGASFVAVSLAPAAHGTNTIVLKGARLLYVPRMN